MVEANLFLENYKIICPNFKRMCNSTVRCINIFDCIEKASLTLFFNEDNDLETYETELLKKYNKKHSNFSDSSYFTIPIYKNDLE